MSHASFHDNDTIPILQGTQNVIENNKRKQKNKNVMNNKLELVRKEKRKELHAKKNFLTIQIYISDVMKPT